MTDIVVEEEREESMETDTPLDSTTPHSSARKSHAGKPRG